MAMGNGPLSQDPKNISRGLMDHYTEKECRSSEKCVDGLSLGISSVSLPMDLMPDQDASYTGLSDGNLDEEPRIVTPVSSFSSLDVSNRTGQVSSDSSEKQKPKKHPSKKRSVVFSKSSPDVHPTSKAAVSAQKHVKKTPPKTTHQANGNRRVDPEAKIPVEKTDKDVLCERGGCSNKHPGNKAYLQHVQGLRNLYQTLQRPLEKTAASQSVVDWVKAHGGRFLKRDGKGGPWYVVTDTRARIKTSQALREGHIPEGCRAFKKHRWKNANKRL